MNDPTSALAGMLPFDSIGLYEQPKPRFIFKMPRVVPDQKSKFESDELFRRLSRESEVSFSREKGKNQGDGLSPGLAKNAPSSCVRDLRFANGLKMRLGFFCMRLVGWSLSSTNICGLVVWKCDEVIWSVLVTNCGCWLV